MSATLGTKIGVCAAGVTCLLMVGYAQAQQIQEPAKPAQYADQDTGRALSNRHAADRPRLQGERRTTFFRGPDAAGSTAASAVQSVDQYLANCLLIKNGAEIELCEFAETRTENPRVKQFAQQLAEDHRQMSQQLKQLAASNRDSANSGSDATLDRLLEIDRQITSQCLSMARDKLSEKSGAEFDRCFVTAQAGGHLQMLAALEVISRQGDGQLRQIALDAKTKVQGHLKHAEALVKELESGSASQTDRQARS